MLWNTLWLLELLVLWNTLYLLELPDNESSYSRSVSCSCFHCQGHPVAVFSCR